MFYYFLNEDKTYRSCDVTEWSEQFEGMCREGLRHVADDIIDEFHVSTVWLGIDHNHFGGSPLLFETMIFKGDIIYCNRYTTWEEAQKGHKKSFQWVLGGCKDDPR